MKFGTFSAKFRDLADILAIDVNKLHQFSSLKETSKKMPNAQRAVWRQSGCVFADSLVVIWQFTARRSLSEPPPERQAARRCASAGDSAVG